MSGTALDENGTVELISLWVASDARSKGVGDQLVNEVVRWAANQGAVAVTLAVKTNNAFAIRLYERSGFVLIEGPANADEQVMSRSIR